MNWLVLEDWIKHPSVRLEAEDPFHSAEDSERSGFSLFSKLISK